MAITCIRGTDEVFQRLGLPLSAMEHMGPLNEVIVCDFEKQIALVPHQFHHSEYPDQRFTLYIKGKALQIDCERKFVEDAAGRKSPLVSHVSLQRTKEFVEMSDDQIKRVVHDYFSVAERGADMELDVRIRPVPQHAKSRPIEMLVKHMNTIAELAVQHRVSLSDLLGMQPRLVRSLQGKPEEIEEVKALLCFLEGSEAGMLSPSALEIINWWAERLKEEGKL